MRLEDEIRQINNPQEFVELCNNIFVAKYGDNNFQIIDGTRGDGGNDGYVYSEERLFAIHCPIKPEKRTDRDFEQKIYEDLEKAKKLRDSGKFKIKNWTFVTPNRLSNCVIANLIKKAEEIGFVGNHIEATHLANELYQHKHLLEKFPNLHILRIEDKLTEILEVMKSHRVVKSESPVNDDGEYKKVTIGEKTTEDLKKVLAILRKDETNTSKAELKSIFYKTTDKIAQVNVILGLIRWYSGAEDNPKDMIWWCDQGLTLAESLKDEGLRALFLAHKGYYLSIIWAFEDAETAFTVKAGNTLGVSLLNEEQKQIKLNRFRLLEEQFNTAFRDSLEIINKLKNASIAAQILMIIGEAAGQRYLHLNYFGVERAEEEKALAKRAILNAKEIYSIVGDELGVGYAMNNLANYLAVFGEKEEAIKVVEGTIEIATKYKDESLLQTANWIKDKLITGKVPDYIHGERRERKKRAL